LTEQAWEGRSDIPKALQAIGTDLAARQQQRSGIIITAVDDAPDIEAALKDPEQIQASASQAPFFMARRADRRQHSQWAEACFDR
jgi:ABC-type sugar transport system substrate-binding protein